MNNYEVIGGCYSPHLTTFLDLYYFSYRSKPYSVTATIPDKTTWERFPHHVHFPTQQKYFRNDAFAERKSLPQFNVASYKHPGIRLPFEYTTTLLSGEGAEERTGTATMFRKMLPKDAIFSTVLSTIVVTVLNYLLHIFWLLFPSIQLAFWLFWKQMWPVLVSSTLSGHPVLDPNFFPDFAWIYSVCYSRYCRL